MKPARIAANPPVARNRLARPRAGGKKIEPGAGFGRQPLIATLKG